MIASRQRGAHVNKMKELHTMGGVPYKCLTLIRKYPQADKTKHLHLHQQLDPE